MHACTLLKSQGASSTEENRDTPRHPSSHPRPTARMKRHGCGRGDLSYLLVALHHAKQSQHQSVAELCLEVKKNQRREGALQRHEETKTRDRFCTRADATVCPHTQSCMYAHIYASMWIEEQME